MSPRSTTPSRSARSSVKPPKPGSPGAKSKSKPAQATKSSESSESSAVAPKAPPERSVARKSNADVADLFERMAAALELIGANPFRVTSDARVARVLRDCPDDIEHYVDEDPAEAVRKLSEIPGIGKGSAARIVEFFETGAIAELDELMRQVPSGLFAVLEIPGLGPKTVRALWKDMGITCIEDLKSSIDSPEFKALPRMGAKTIENIKKAMAFMEKSGARAPIGIVLPVAQQLVEFLRSLSFVDQAQYAGSLRRGKETIGDIDLIVSVSKTGAEEQVRDAFTTMEGVTQVLARGESKCSVRIDRRGLAIQADLRIVPPRAFGAALLYFSGSKEHNVRLREISIRKGLHLNEYGLFAGTEDRPQDQGAKPLAAESESDVYQALGFSWIPPELREDRGELERPVPELIEMSDIRAELHCHTSQSDGKLSLDELINCARKRGFHTIAVTDHSQSSVIANGLDPARLRKHIQAIHQANGKYRDITVLAGSEVDILPDGRLDYDDDLLAELDVVVASPHVSLRQDPGTATRRLLKAIEHPLVHIIGHPTGRIVGSREGLDPDMKTLCAAAAEHDTVLEINANWKRLDLRDTHIMLALDAGCNISIDTDAHKEEHFDYLIYGILTGRRGGLTAERCINTWPAKKLHAWFRNKRSKAQ